MTKIHVLDSKTANKIAAGEVVERPASVIKELVENAIDAKATSILIAIEHGGIHRMQVTDNGSGIEADQVATAFLRHATSKIENDRDLDAIGTLGFRGEALASIAAVSKVRMITRTRESDLGSEIRLEGGKVLCQEECGCAEGTSITVEDLFFNTPARLKFLHSTAAETGAISDIVLRLILANPEISIRFTNNGKMVYHSPGSGLLDAIQCVYGKEIAKKVLPIRSEAEGIVLNGYVGLPEIARQSRVHQSLFINGRYVKSSRISNAIQQGYGQRLMIGRYPFYVLHVQIPLDRVDVNVHPQKLEVRFSREDALCTSITDSVRELFSRQSDVRDFQPQSLQEQTTEHRPEESVAKGQKPDDREVAGAEAMDLSQTMAEVLSDMKREVGESFYRFFKEESPIQHQTAADPGQGIGLDLQKTGNTRTVAEQEERSRRMDVKDPFQPETIEMPQQVRMEEEDSPFSDYQLIGQVFSTFILVQSGDALYFIDQHAGHERLTYERYLREAAAQEVAMQYLLAPTVIELTFEEMRIFEQHRQEFTDLGFEAVPFGPTQVALRAIPVLLAQDDMVGMFHDVLDAIALGKDHPDPEILQERMIRSACRHSIKGGERLTEAEIAALMEQLKKTEKLTCPHGRPICIKMTKYELEKGFKRIV